MRRLASAALVAATTFATAPLLAFDGWHLESAVTIEGKGSAWDYLTLDAGSSRLFIGHRKEGLQVFDLAAKRLVKTVDNTMTQSSNGATLMPSSISASRTTRMAR